VTWALLRGAIYSAMFILVMLIMGLISSWWALLALPASVLIGFAFAGAGMALVSRAIRSTAIQLRDESNGTSRKQYIRDAASCSRFLSGKVNRFVALEMVEGTAA